MNTKSRTVLGLALVLCLAGGTIVLAEGEIKMTGSYVWERDDRDIPGDIEAVFTSTGENAWEVVFRFEWEGEMRTWKGHAQGSLKTGALEGEATEDRDRERSFVFKGETKDGVFTGEHGAMREGKMNNLGTITLKMS